MSESAVGAFLSALAQDRALAAGAEQALAAAADPFAALAEMAQRHGYEVTADEIRAASRATWWGRFPDDGNGLESDTARELGDAELWAGLRLRPDVQPSVGLSQGRRYRRLEPSSSR
jgi:hypothetical protein